jgi:DNA-binding GntR family transcriptional regulator
LRSQALTITPVRRTPLSGEVYRTLRKMIVQGQLTPGVKVIEHQVASLLGVSRTPVREALQRLEYDGLLATRPGHSTRVTAPTVQDIDDIYPVIATLEGLAARLAVSQLSSADVHRMEDLSRAMARHARRGEIDKLLAADTKFHAVIHEASQNRHIQRAVAELRGKMERFEFAFFSSPRAVRASLKRHRNLVRVLRQRDPRVAQRTLERQWDLGRKTLLKIYQSQTAAASSPEAGPRRRRQARRAPVARPTRLSANSRPRRAQAQARRGSTHEIH